VAVAPLLRVSRTISNVRGQLLTNPAVISEVAMFVLGGPGWTATG